MIKKKTKMLLLLFFIFVFLLAKPVSIESSYPMIGVSSEHRFKANVSAGANNLYWDFPVRVSNFSGIITARLNFGDSIIDFVIFAGEGILCCLRDNGELYWQVQLNPDGSVQGFPGLLTDNRQILISVDDSLISFDLITGTRIWATQLSGNGWHSTIWRDRVYIADEAGYLSCYNLDDSSLRWRQGPLGGGLFNTTATVDSRGNVYIATLGNSLQWYDWKIYSFDSLGNLRWVQDYLAFEPGGIQMTMPLGGVNKVFHHSCFLPSWGCGIYAVDSSGVRWHYAPIDFQTYYSSIAFDQSRGCLYLGTSTGLLVLDTLGNFVREFLIGSITYSSPLIDSLGRILVGTDDGVFYILDLDGQIIFRYATDDGPLGSPAIGMNGNVYIAGSTKLFCFSALPGIEKEERRTKTCVNYRDLKKVYNILGQELKMNDLRSGIYFQGGKKIVIME